MDQNFWKILMVDDDEDDYLITRQMLAETRRGTHSLDWARTFAEGWQKLTTGDYDVVLIDYSLGEQDGLDLIRQIIKNDRHPPFVLYTGRGSYNIDLEAMQAGATLYLNKGEMNPATLERSLRYTIRHKQTEKQYRDLIRHAPAAIYEIDFQNQRFISVNDAMCALSGYTRQELLDMDPFDILDEDGRLLFQERIRRWLAGEEPAKNVEYRVKAKDGHTIYAVLNVTYTKNIYGRPLGATVIGFDVTERRRTEAILQESEARFRTMVDGTPLMIWVTDAHGQVEFVNQAYQDFFGVTVAQVQIQGWSPLVHPDDHAGYVEVFHTSLHQQRPFTAEARVLRHDGEWRWVASYGQPRFSASGQFLGNAGSSLDITERKQIEKSLQAYTEQLKRSNQELENFAFMASHDLREPLRKIETFSQQLAHMAGPHLDETGRDYLERMRSASQRMTKMIDDLLTLSRVTSRGVTFTMVDLNQVARSVLDNLEVSLRQVNGKVELSDLPTIQADRLQMEQLLQNLIGNALKFHRPGIPPVVRVCSKSILVSRPADQVEISVADNGTGFKEEQSKIIFEPFRRLHKRTEYEGTGIGLSICQKIIERHGGSITAHSTLGQGATFIVTLPVEQH